MIDKEKEIIVTGAGGFLGKYVMKRLKKRGYLTVYPVRSQEYDLTSFAQCLNLLDGPGPEAIIHMAAVVGGIGANKDNPGKFFYDNMAMGLNLIEAARRTCPTLKKFVMVGTVCSYPKFCKPPFKEEDLWEGYPEETNAPYGIAKKALYEMIRGYHQQYAFPGIVVVPVNLYGPGDSTDLKNNHVIPAMILKMLKAKKQEEGVVKLWGTGNVSREFLYVEDCAKGIVKAMEYYDNPSPINLGTGREIRIRDLAGLIAKLTGYKGKIVFDESMPDGQPRRCLDVQKAWKAFGFCAETDFEEGLKQTIEWAKEHV